MNCVRSNNIDDLKASLGFLTDLRRLNVAITRAKHFLFIVGNKSTLIREQTGAWRRLIESCEERKQNENSSNKISYFRTSTQNIN